MRRRAFLAAAAGGGLLAYGGLVEPRALSYSTHRVRLGPAGAAALPQPGGGRTLRLVQLSDLHLDGVGAREEALARGVDDLRPDLLLLTGDSVDDRGNLPLLGELLAMLATDAPAVAVMGNWEYKGDVRPEALARELGRHGGELLLDTSRVFALGGAELLVTGLDDWLRGRPDPGRALAGAPARLRELGHHLVLAHCPVHRDVLQAGVAGAGVPWVLAGHTHGGQVGFGRLRATPRGSGRYVRGWYRAGLPDLYVSRGIGTSAVPLRVGSRPEVAVFDVELD